VREMVYIQRRELTRRRVTMGDMGTTRPGLHLNVGQALILHHQALAAHDASVRERKKTEKRMTG
jgi:hypothetical protein